MPLPLLRLVLGRLQQMYEDVELGVTAPAFLASLDEDVEADVRTMRNAQLSNFGM